MGKLIRLKSRKIKLDGVENAMISLDGENTILMSDSSRVWIRTQNGLYCTSLEQISLLLKKEQASWGNSGGTITPSYY